MDARYVHGMARSLSEILGRRCILLIETQSDVKRVGDLVCNEWTIAADPSLEPEDAALVLEQCSKVARVSVGWDGKGEPPTIDLTLPEN